MTCAVTPEMAESWAARSSSPCASLVKVIVAGARPEPVKTPPFQLPKSKVRLPVPRAASAVAKPVNSRTCPCASAVTSTDAVRFSSAARSEIATDTAAEDEATSKATPADATAKVVRKLSMPARSLPISEIDNSIFSIRSVIWPRFGSTSAAVSVSTSWVMFSPDPLLLSVLR